MIDTFDKNEKMWGMMCHLSAFAFFIFPFGHVLGPLVIYLIKKDEIPFVNDQGKESLNFQISITIYSAVAAILIIVFIGFPLLIIIAVVDFILVIIASLKANTGIPFRYPLSIRIIK